MDIDDFVIHLISVYDNMSSNNDKYFDNNFREYQYLINPLLINLDQKLKSTQINWQTLAEDYPIFQ
jgi:hypothetical protein